MTTSMLIVKMFGANGITTCLGRQQIPSLSFVALPLIADIWMLGSDVGMLSLKELRLKNVNDNSVSPDVYRQNIPDLNIEFAHSSTPACWVRASLGVGLAGPVGLPVGAGVD